MHQTASSFWDMGLYDLYKVGGGCMILLFTAGIVCISVIMERFLVLRQARAVDNNALRQQINDLIEEGNIPQAVLICQSTPGPIASVLAVGLRKFNQLKRWGKSPEAVEAGMMKAMEDFSIQVVHSLERNLNILSILGNLSPLLGMTGTVTGMISSFSVIATKATVDAKDVGGGISEAFTNTAVGLLIAIVSVVAYHYLHTMVRNMIMEMEKFVSETAELVNVKHQEDLHNMAKAG